MAPLRNDQLDVHAPSQTPDAGTTVAPGKRTATARLAPSATAVAREVMRLMRKADGDNGVAPEAEHAIASASAGSGAPLPDEVRTTFESSLGADLSQVRVHTGAESAIAAKSVSARAYTTGNDIHFADGEYRPGDPCGLHLLAHEVAHTVQQTGGDRALQYKLEVSTPGDALEQEADRAADAMVVGAPAEIAGRSSAPARMIQRDYHPGRSETAYNPHQDDWFPETNWSAAAAPVAADATAMTSPWQFAPVVKGATTFQSLIRAAPDMQAYGNLLTLATQSFGQVCRDSVSAWNGAVPAINEYLTTSSSAEPVLRSLSGLEGIGKGDIADLAERRPLSGSDLTAPRAFAGLDTPTETGVTIEKKALSQEERDDLIALQDDVQVQTQIVVSSQGKLGNFANLVKIQMQTADTAISQIQISQKEFEGEAYEQEVRKLKAIKDAIVGAINGVTSITKGMLTAASPGKPEVQAANQTSGAGDMISGFGKLAETGVGLYFDSKINDVYGKILALKSQILALKVKQSMHSIAIAVETAANAANDGREYYANTYLKAVGDRKKAIMKLAQKMQAAAQKSGAGDDKAQAVGSAIRALPLVEEVVQAIRKVEPLLSDGPSYTPLSGRGASLYAAETVADVSAHLGTMKGVKAHFATNKEKWEQRLTAIQGLIAAAR